LQSVAEGDEQAIHKGHDPNTNHSYIVDPVFVAFGDA
jgi:hypothetical protein